MMATSLFQKYGGFAKVSRIVLTFYDKVLDSDQIGEFFDGVDMSRLVDHQTKFISSLLGGPASYTDERLRQLHAHLGITDADMDEMAKLLSEALEEHGVEPADRELVMREIEARRRFIVQQGAA
jgi:hemoglobin